MNVYDFDKTIFYPDSSFMFLLYCCNRHPKLYFIYFPKLLFLAFKYKFKRITKNELGYFFFAYFKYLDDLDELVAKFWKKHEKNVLPWYLKQKRNDDVIISASPEFLLKPIVDKLGVKLYGTNVNPKTGETIGKIQLSKEKSKHILNGDIPFIDNFYSDSLADTPLALCAEHAYIVSKKGKEIKPWPHINEVLTRKIKKKINFD